MEIIDILEPQLIIIVYPVASSFLFSKAFNTANHQILLTKLYRYVVRIVCNLFKLKMKNLIYQRCLVVYHKGQLVPVYFKFILITLLTQPAELSFRLFADDTNTFYTSNDINNTKLLCCQQIICEKKISVNNVIKEKRHSKKHSKF